MYHPELTQTRCWYPSTCEVFLSSLRRYVYKLKPLARKGTTSINGAIKRSELLITLIEEKMSAGGDEIALPLLGKDIAMIYSLVARYSSYKNQLLRESTSIPEAQEPGKEELEIVQRTLQTLEACKVPRGQVVEVPFYGDNEEKGKEQIPASQLIRIGTLYNMNGQFVGFNSGDLAQAQDNSILTTLNTLSEIIDKEAPEDIKKEALADILTLNAQVVGGKPDKSIMQKTLDKLTSLLKGGLKHGAETAQIYAVVIAPHLAEIKKFIDSIAH